MNALGEKDWNNLIKAIEKKQCAFFLGHGLLTDPADGRPLYSKLCEKLNDDCADKIEKYYEDGNFFVLKAARNRTDLTNEIEDYYNSLQPDMDLYQKLAEIPVSLYISVSPDQFLKKVLGEEAQTVVYSDHAPKVMDIEAAGEKPLIYNIFGSVEDSSSLRLTHDNLFDFFKNILGNKALPETVETFFREGAAGEVIFLGFTFQTWYVRLLLRLFNLSNKETSLYNSRAYLYEAAPKDEAEFAEQNFQVKYVDDGLKNFVDTLHQKCKEKGMLRPLNTTKKELVTNARKVFISYNHKDQETALRIGKALTASGFEVIIDVNKMRSGQNIKEFIMNCIRESGVTLSLVSADSLMSAWVTMETVTSSVEAGLRKRPFIPCYIDGSFLDRAFSGQAMEKIESELREIKDFMSTALEKGWGTEDMDAERTRYLKMKTELPGIIGQLRDSLCIDLTPEHFDTNMQKIIADLNATDNGAA